MRRKISDMKSCKRKKCPYYELYTNKCTKCELNPNSVWSEKKGR